MSKLFALESAEEEVMVSEMETSVEEGEVADVEVDSAEDSSEIEATSNAAEEGMEAADQLEEIEKVVEASVEEGEGLDPVAAEAIRVAVEAVSARVGYQSKGMFALYAKENFESASSRKANTQIALEGIGDFLKDLWEKIKAAVSNIWTKITDFWNKHISNLGRVLKALESMKKKISETKGSPKQPEKDLKASSSLTTLFPGSGDFDASEIKAYIGTHMDAGKKSGKMSEELTEFLGKSTNMLTVKDSLKQFVPKDSFGTEAVPLVKNTFIEIEGELENEKVNDEDVLKFTLTVNEQTGSKDSDVDRNLSLASKDQLKELINETIKLVKQTIKTRDNVEKANKAFDTAKKDIDKNIAKAMETSLIKNNLKKNRQALNAFATLNSKVPPIGVKLAVKDVQLAKGVLAFTSTCLKNYKD